MRLVTEIQTAADAAAAARSLGPALRERASQCDALRKVPEETIEDLHRSGLLRLMVPHKFGGAGLGFTELVSTGAEIAAACGSTGWVWTACWRRQLVRRRCCRKRRRPRSSADPRTLTASIFRYPAEVKPVERGYRLTNGRGRFSSGIDHADWVLLGVTVDRGSSTPEARMVVVPRSDIEVVRRLAYFRHARHRQLHGAGEGFIPEHRSCSMADLARGTSPGAGLHPDMRTLRVPFSVGAAWCLVGAPLGMARGAYATFTAGSAGKLRDLRAEQIAAQRGTAFRADLRRCCRDRCERRADSRG